MSCRHHHGHGLLHFIALTAGWGLFLWCVFVVLWLAWRLMVMLAVALFQLLALALIPLMRWIADRRARRLTPAASPAVWPDG